MEKKTITGIPLSIWSDQILKVSYVKVLESDFVEEVKLPTEVNNYKNRHLIQPNYLLSMELIKTKKNWVLRSVLQAFKICELNEFQDYLHFSNLVKKIDESVICGQQITGGINIFQQALEEIPHWDNTQIQIIQSKWQSFLGYGKT